MKPLNQKERNTTYFRFLLLFISTNILVAFAIWLNCEVKEKELKVLKSQLETYRKSDDLPRLMNEKTRQLDSLLGLLVDPDQSDKELELLGDITRILNSLPVPENEANSPLDSLCNKIRIKYYGILEDKKKIKASQLTTGLVGEMERENKEIKKELQDCKDDNNKLRAKLE